MPRFEFIVGINPFNALLKIYELMKLYAYYSAGNRGPVRYSANALARNFDPPPTQGWICQGGWGGFNPPGQKSDPTSKSWTNVLGVVN